MRKKILPLVMCMAVVMSGCGSKGTPADQWVVDQYASLETIELFCEDLDEVVNLYSVSAIDQATYLDEMEIIDSELYIMEETRPLQKIKPGSHSEMTKRAQEGYETLWKDLRNLVNALKTDAQVIQNKDALNYLYMAYKESIKSDVEDYVLGYEYCISKTQ